jgi:proton glutamate symport protein
MSALSTPGAASRSRLPGLTTQIFIGLALGIVIGHVWPDTGVAIRPLADLFLRLIKMILAPLIFSTLVIGIAGTGDLKAVGRIGLKAIVWFELATTIALVIGLVMVNVIRPGAGVALPAGADTASLSTMAHSQQGGWDILLHMVPTSVVDAMAKNDILQVVVFASFFGVALAAVGARGAVIVDLLDNVAHVMFKVTGYVMRFAPIGVLAAMAATVGGKGLGILVTLGALVLTMYTGLVIFVALVIGGAALVTRVPFVSFVRAVRETVSHRVHHRQRKPHCPRPSKSWSASACRSASSLRAADQVRFNLDGSTLYCRSRRSSSRSSPASS